jgi:16S rRNA A1518/A1519 N6-dimethyltransferase RsmA/KsgA/DIM1 with predicted DNA glycosylase/AP lyase activity
MISTLMGQPFVPTRSAEMAQILVNSNLKKGQKLLELGCGDGRFLNLAVQRMEVIGTGVELNPLLALFAKLRGFITRTKNYDIKVADIRKISYAEYDAIYLFLFPSLIEQIQDKFLQEGKKGSIVISHGFVVPAIHKYLDNTYSHHPSIRE